MFVLWWLNVGKALSLALAQKGVFLTIVDFSEEKGNEVAILAKKENAKFHLKLEFPSVIFVKCDVTNSSKLFTCMIEYNSYYMLCLRMRERCSSSLTSGNNL